MELKYLCHLPLLNHIYVHFPHQFLQNSIPHKQKTVFLKFHNFSSKSMANVVVLKVNLHCDECTRKILKAIKKIEDIETYDVDTQLNKVTVTGNVTTNEVIKVLQKIRKTASPWEGDENTALN